MAQCDKYSRYACGFGDTKLEQILTKDCKAIASAHEL